ncbi:MAG: nuclear transport factor 2 family protein [Candidatus Bathyarchaeota archaeon]|nr:MAG: nuclear transport factor 2 family protein [Candidatus Bathyarchaeota archaeon]
MNDLPSTEEDAKAQVHKFCMTLMRNDSAGLLNLFGKDALLFWGPYSFRGEDIKRWASELREMFPVLFIKEKSLEVKGNQVRHEFLIESVTKDGQRAWLPCIGTYVLSEGRIQSLTIELLHGWLAVKKEDLERVRPPPSTS